MFTIITLNELGYSTHVIYSEEIAQRMFDLAVENGGPSVQAIFLYGPEGQINNWWSERQ